MKATSTGIAAKVAAIIDRERRASKVSQRALAEKIGISLSAMQRSLSGQRDFTFEEMVNIARVLHVPPEQFYADAA